MAASNDVFVRLKEFVSFDEKDAANLQAVAPVFAKHGAGITDAFYATLGKFPETAKQIEGRVDLLKATHGRWMGELFSGVYDEAYFNNRLRIGLMHVKIGLDPHWVEGVMCLIRTEAVRAINAEIADRNVATAAIVSTLKMLDLDLMIINIAYGEERLDRLAKFTGMSRRLLETCIRKG